MSGNASESPAVAVRPGDAAQGSAIELRDVEPWAEPVSGKDVLDEIAKVFSRYMSLPDGAADALALWCAHTHVYELFDCTPRLNISSPDKQCGKTTLRDVTSLFVSRPMRAENLTVAVLFRLVQKVKPTILADESDSWLRDNEELRGMLNSGHRRGGKAYRCEGKTHDIRAFDVFAPVVLCGIGSLPGTLHDRSIVIRLARAKPGELRDRFNSRRTQHEQELCRKLARFCADSRAALAIDPILPAGAFNRIADNWRPLFAIAEAAGEDWPARASSAFAKLTVRDDVDAQSIGTILLADIKSILVETKTVRIFSRALVAKLCSMTDRAWPEANRGKPITETWLAGQLRVFSVSSKDIRIGKDHAKGYVTADFADAFERYLPETADSTRDTVTNLQESACDEVLSRDNEASCHGLKLYDSGTNAEWSRCHASDADMEFTVMV